MDYVEQCVEMCRFKKRPFALVDGQLFIRNDRWIMPLGPAGQAYHLDKAQCRYLLRKLGGLWVMWTDGFESSAFGSEWYAVICKKYRTVEEIPDGKRRSELRRALRDCDVRQVDAEEIAMRGYETYCAAVRGYCDASIVIPAKQEFQRRVKTDAPFGEYRHQWGVYCGGKMIAFAQNLIYDTVEADYTMIKIHPEYLKHYPIYALVHKMNEYYLAQKGFQYVNDGFRSILHATGIQEFLIKKFGFEKAYTGLHVHYRPPFDQALCLVRPFHGVLEKIYPRIKALFEVDRIRMRSD